MNLQEKLNYYGKKKIPILFKISYDMKSWEIFRLDSLPDDIYYSINKTIKSNLTLNLDITKPSFNTYENQFNKIINNIKNGNTYILNLTTQTIINNKFSLKDIYNNTNAKYKFLYKNDFLSFSPETFIKINNNIISTYPMKGTIDANIKDAKNILLNDKKELAEHTMIVDLLRNDLSIVANNIKVDKFRYIEKIKTRNINLYQTSSKISATLDKNWQSNLGNIITSMLPAGSITGTPKISTIKLIKDIENYNREYFTGIWGVFDGNSLDSAVLIRFIQNNNGSLVYKSGGGITIDSNCIGEYNETIQKVYIP